MIYLNLSRSTVGRFAFLIQNAVNLETPLVTVTSTKRSQVDGTLFGDAMTKEIKITRGMVTLVDDSDYEWLNQWKWYAQKGTYGKYYVMRTSMRNLVRSAFLMHRVIMDAPVGMEVDHINGNSLDNRRKNLRICTRAENGANRKKQKNNTTGYKGVRPYFHKWSARLDHKKKSVFLGLYKTPEEAARAYDAGAKKYFGEFAKLNFPENTEL